jgi:hypothetical protein
VYDFEAANKYKRELDDTTFGSPEKAREWFYEKVYARPPQLVCSASSVNALLAHTTDITSTRPSVSWSICTRYGGGGPERVLW